MLNSRQLLAELRVHVKNNIKAHPKKKIFLIQSHYRQQSAKRDALRSCRNITTLRSLHQSNECPTMSLFDSLSKTYKEVPLSLKKCDPTTTKNEEKEPKKGLAWYTCGPTVYDSAHLGHGRTYVTLDIIHRILLNFHRVSKSSSPPPIFIMNVTDIDDKIIDRAKENNESPIALARRFEAEFWSDMEALNVMRPTVITRVTEHVEDSIIPYIERIVNNDMAYVIRNDSNSIEGSVYFDVGLFENSKGKLNKYGKLAPQTTTSRTEENHENVFFEWGGNEDRGAKVQQRIKKDPRDFVLWKNRSDGEEELLWDSPWGLGRPGWHIECSAMIESIAQEFPSHDISIHAGGIDLKFPHHTNEIAQAEAYHLKTKTKERKEWIPHWVHTGHLHVKGRKMSKSLKNFITIKELLGGNDSASSSIESPADDFRLWCLGLSGRYTEPATYSDVRLEESKVARQKLLRFFIDGEEWIRKSQHGSNYPTTRWGKDEHLLLEMTNHHCEQCHRAIMGLASSRHEKEEETATAFDMDGSAFLRSILSIAEGGSEYINRAIPGQHPIEALVRVISILRQHLSLVGFSDKTVKAGANDSHLIRNKLAGDESAIIDELWHFRDKVRNIVLNNNKDDSENELSKKILYACDYMRDSILPSIGVEINDNIDKKWRFCLPRREQKENFSPLSVKGSAPVSQDLVDTINMFSVGNYAGMFSKYDNVGVPTHNSDGTQISKRLRKKLLKKRQKFIDK